MPPLISTPLIEARDLTRRFDDVVAVDHFNVSVQPGEIFGLVGPDGAGKTTTLRLLCGLMEPTGGEARVAGHDVRTEAHAIKDRVGYMAQRFGLYADLTVDENMEFYADIFGVSRAQRDQLTPSLLHMTRMEPFRKRQAGRLSGGMKQKLAVMCTLLHRPQVLFLDEPTNGVDPVSRREFWTILHQLVQGGVTLFVTTAYLDEAERCNRVGLLHHGRLIQCDSPRALKRHVGEFCYEVETPDPRVAREWLQKQPGVLSAELFGSVLHVFLDGRTPPQVFEGQLSRSRLRQIEPSLEDVFIALTRVKDVA